MTDSGIHHVTAIGGPAQRTLDFYRGTLGLRLVKRTVNFDDPGSWHLYFADADGTPGSVLTFFPWEHAAPGRAGSGEVGETMFRVPAGSLDWWMGRLAAFGAARATRFGAAMVQFADPDGLRLALVEVADAALEPAWAGADVAAGQAIRGLHGVTLDLADPRATAAVLTDVFGFAPGGQQGEVARHVAAGSRMGGIVDLRVQAGPAARQGRGSVHHLAFRAADDAAQAAMVDRLARRHGIHATAQKDRDYFRSVYFSSPGGVLFEIATDVPGFAVDEAAASLGSTLQLPAFLRPHRARIAAALPALA